MYAVGFASVLKEDTTYKEFVSEKAPSEESQKAFIKHLARKIILGAGVINDYFEEQNIRWAEDKDIIKKHGRQKRLSRSLTEKPLCRKSL